MDLQLPAGPGDHSPLATPRFQVCARHPVRRAPMLPRPCPSRCRRGLCALSASFLNTFRRSGADNPHLMVVSVPVPSWVVGRCCALPTRCHNSRANARALPALCLHPARVAVRHEGVNCVRGPVCGLDRASARRC